MPEVLATFTDVLLDEDGIRYHAHACGAQTSHGTWEGWLEFIPLDGGPPVRSGRETTQPNRTAAEYWATGLTAVYLEGALERALQPPILSPPVTEAPVFDGPAPAWDTADQGAAGRDAVLDPFAVYESGGAALLRRQLSALAAWHLVNVIEAYDLDPDRELEPNRLLKPALIDAIVSAVEQEFPIRSGSRARPTGRTGRPSRARES